MENICRICLEEDTILIDLKTCRYKTKLSYYEIFIECTGISLNEAECSLICRSCKDLLGSAYELRVRAQKSAEFLRSKSIEVVEVKCDTVLVEVKEEVEDVQIKEEEQEIDDQKMNDDVDNVDNEKKLRPKKRKKGKKAKKVPINSKNPWKYRCRICLNLKASILLKLRCERLHIKKNNGLECNHCDYRSSVRDQLENHLYSHFVDPNRFKCPDCPSTHNSYSSFDNHRWRFHPKDGIYLHTCEICGRVLRSRHGLTAHKARCHQPNQEMSKKFICDICGKRSADHHNIKIHILHVHLRKYECSYCQEVFNRSMHLRDHIESKHPDKYKKKMLICDICGKEFKQKVSLQTHQFEHTGEYPFKCTVEGCTAVFRQKVSLDRHKRVHDPSSVEFYQCEFCPKQFQLKASLRVHTHLHKNILHQCELCEKSFKLRYQLKEHVESAHEGKRFYCPTCEASFTSKRNMRRHMRSFCTASKPKKDDNIDFDLLGSF